jgi:hypothetical protein
MNHWPHRFRALRRSERAIADAEAVNQRPRRARPQKQRSTRDGFSRSLTTGCKRS